jgi:DNA-binding response OmpR family regulator
MRILCYLGQNLNLPGFNTVFVYDENGFYDIVLNKKFDVVLISFDFFGHFLEIREYIKSTVVFVNYYCDSLIYKKVLEVADYCYLYTETDKLKLRLEYLRKKTLKTKSGVFKIKNLLYNFVIDELYQNSEPVKLSSAEKELLRALIKNRNRYLSKEDILMECDTIESEASIKVLISHLRKLGIEIENQKNSGYILKD